MKTFRNLLAVSFSMLMVSCFAEEENTPISDDVIYPSEVYARIDSDGLTRVHADENLKVLWDEDDRISLFNKYTFNKEYRFAGTANADSGPFREVTSGGVGEGSELDNVYAVYPYLSETSVSEAGVVSLTLPSEQTYSANSFGSGANVMVSVTESTDLLFKNLCGYLILKLYGDGVSVNSITLKGNLNEPLAGSVIVSASVGSVPTLSFGTVGATDEITLVCQTPVELGSTAEDATVFWLVVPPTTFSEGFSITVSDPYGNTFEKSANINAEIVRNKTFRMSALEVEMFPEGNIEFSDQAFKDYLVEKFDKDKDKEISYKEARDIKEINVVTGNIGSMQGIEYMPNLEILICDGPNAIIAHDVISSLSTRSGEGAGLLTDLDVSSNAKLSYLSCQNNSISDLDLSNNQSLETLICNDNCLADLDISNNNLLETLHCSSNQLSSLNVSNNPNLSQLDCFPMEDENGDNLLDIIYVNDDQVIDGITNNREEGNNNIIPEATMLSTDGPKGTGTKEDPFNAAAAIEVTKGLSWYSTSNYETVGPYYVKGKVVSIKEPFSAEYGNSSFYISKDGTTNTQQFQIYRTWYLGDRRWSEGDEMLKVGDEVVICGMLMNYRGTTPESEMNNAYIYSLNGNVADVACVPIEDPNFKIALLNGYDTNGDGEISIREADNIRYLCLSSSEINSLNGIEYLDNLFYLRVEGTGITNLVLSNNQLDTLYCRNNHIESIDVTNCPSLKTLNCDNNQLTELDLPNSHSLQFLYCSSNQLTELDLSNSHSLQFLYCSSNQLTELDLSNNLNLQEVDCSSNPLVKLFLAQGQEIPGIYPDRYDSLIPAESRILIDGVDPEEIVDIEDSNFKAYLVENYDLNSDGEISVTEAERIESIEVYGFDISSLKGIERMPNLISMFCGSNQLTTLDVSYNLKLQNLQCPNNQLTNLDVSNNVNLIELGCSENQLTTLDVSNNLNLQNLQCSNNQLTNLDVSNNNQLTNLNVSNSVNLIELGYSSNQLTTLDVSNNPELLYLNCLSNQLATLDVSKNKNLKDLSCGLNRLTTLDVSNNLDLRSLNCSSNQLTSIDVSNNPRLEELACESNQLTTLDVSVNEVLRGLNCNSNQLTSINVSNNVNLQDLRCSSTQLTALDVSNNPNLRFLYCDTNQLTDIDLSKNPNLRSLECGSNQIATLDLSNNPNLRTLGCDSNRLTTLDVSDKVSLQWFNCSSNLLTDLDVSNNVNLIYLYCQENELTTLDLSNNPNLEALICVSNPLTKLYLAQGQVIQGIYPERDDEIIPAATEIIIQ